MSIMENEIKHTPLPWKACHDGDCSCGMVWSLPDDFPVAAALSTCRNNETYNLGEGLSPHSEQFRANVKFIVEACNNYYQLKKELADKGERINELEELVIAMTSGNSKPYKQVK